MPALVELDLAVAVEVLVAGEWWPGLASAYRGRRIYMTWTKGTWDAAPDAGAGGPRKPDLTTRTAVRAPVQSWVDGRRHVAGPRPDAG